MPQPAVDAVYDTSILVNLDKLHNSTTLGLATFMFEAMIMLMSDTLSHVNKLSLIFRMETIDFSTVKPLIDPCVQAEKVNPGSAQSTDTGM